MSNTASPLDSTPSVTNMGSEAAQSWFKTILSNPFYIVLVTFVVTAVLYTLVRFLLNKYKDMAGRQETQPILIKKIQEASEPSVIDAKFIPDSDDGGAYTVSVWLFINEFERGKLKHVLHKGSEDYAQRQPAIWIHPDTNNLIVDFKVGRDAYEPVSSNQIFASVSKRGSLRNAKKVFVNTHYEDKHKNVIRRFPSNIVQRGQYTVQDIEDWCENDENDCVGFFGVIDASPENNYKNKNIEYAVVGAEKGDYENVRFGRNPLYNPHSSSMQRTFVRKDGRTVSNVPGNNFDPSNSIEVSNIPLGRWFHVAVVAKEQVAEVYIDGSLQESKVLTGPVENNKGDVFLTQNGGFDGLITQLRYFNYAIAHDEVRNIYTCGPTCWQWPSIQKAQEMVSKKINKQARRIGNKFERTYDRASSFTDNILDNIY